MIIFDFLVLYDIDSCGEEIIKALVCTGDYEERVFGREFGKK